MRLKLLACVVALATWLAGCGHSGATTDAGATGSALTPARACAPPAAKVIASNAQIQTYSSGADLHSVSVCRRADRRRFVIWSPAGQVRATVSGVVVMRDSVAYASVEPATDVAKARVAVFDATLGRTVASVRAFTGRARPESFDRVTRLLLAPSGAVAWISRRDSVFGPTTLEVHALKLPTATRLLARGPGIEANSLRIEGNTLLWREGAATKSATL